jgi:hypothetical protein
LLTSVCIFAESTSSLARFACVSRLEVFGRADL